MDVKANLIDESAAEQLRESQKFLNQQALKHHNDYYDRRAEYESDEAIERYKAEPKLMFFRYEHLSEELAKVSESFSRLAHTLVATLEPGAERDKALDSLLAAKDAAVRAKLYPGL